MSLLGVSERHCGFWRAGCLALDYSVLGDVHSGVSVTSLRERKAFRSILSHIDSNVRGVLGQSTSDLHFARGCVRVCHAACGGVMFLGSTPSRGPPAAALLSPPTPTTSAHTPLTSPRGASPGTYVPNCCQAQDTHLSTHTASSMVAMSGVSGHSCLCHKFFFFFLPLNSCIEAVAKCFRNSDAPSAVCCPLIPFPILPHPRIQHCLVGHLHCSAGLAWIQIC